MTEGAAINAAWDDYLGCPADTPTPDAVVTDDPVDRAVLIVYGVLICTGLAMLGGLGAVALDLPTWAQFIPFAALIPVIITAYQKWPWEAWNAG